MAPLPLPESLEGEKKICLTQRKRDLHGQRERAFSFSTIDPVAEGRALVERDFLILAACGVICTDECFFWKVFWWPICCLDREAGNFNFFFAGCGF